MNDKETRLHLRRAVRELELVRAHLVRSKRTCPVCQDLRLVDPIDVSLEADLGLAVHTIVAAIGRVNSRSPESEPPAESTPRPFTKEAIP